ncbi:hypothetical protein [Sulfuricurvum sp.]|uniref:hypothetical protein n=1 Tax=Sulfuricurvum sp. TaxID=2025608 RepID=UPI002E3667E7|nr:hypothetical protein [Sulfuricurvum sp.]HEX5329879.1 hypothetical protein [Sulfuricurvum sp.]
MKKLLLLIPVSLLAVSGFFWFTHDSATPQTQSVMIHQPMPTGAKELFSLNESALRKIIHHGDTASVSLINTSFDALESKLKEDQKAGYSISKLQTILSTYKEDTTFLTQKFAPRLEALRHCDQFELSHEKPFLTSVDQIGLHELKSAYFELDTIRNRYLKNPTVDDKIAYEHENQRLHNIIVELYLDAPIEKPLLAYLDNHKHYFEVISSAYDELGYDRVERLRTNAYAIKSELQLLPSI